MEPKFSVSTMCMDLLRAGEQLTALEGRADALHVDLIDAHFAPNLALSPDFVRALRRQSVLPIEVHLMVEHPGDFLEILARNGATTVSFHAEAVTRQAFRLFNQCEELGLGRGLVLTPATSLSSVETLLPRVDLLTLMTVDVGFAGQPFIPEVLTKLAAARDLRDERGYGYEIQVDGACNKATYRRLSENGAQWFVLGSTGLFNLDEDVAAAWSKMEHEFSDAVA